MRNGLDSGTQSPRPETPEPSSIQGRRNAGVQLLDDDGGISDQASFRNPRSPPCFYSKSPFLRYIDGKRVALLEPPPNAYLSPEGLDAWAQDTNGAPFSQETKDELIEFLDVTDEGGLTFKGFLQIYQLQTENDEEETWRDLSNHGFDRMLKLVATRREEAEADMDDASNVPS
ncbi:hypothetical protein D9615_003886 [Tricholomella constricta]|uniref:Uncharacterized protein n=1 Tax=Tricholomella constricta TaxID=117010 RepID=A0A8H5HCV4_9AGAR|nr:hypothetical protein D9615_003886 [Tricholomella constricta]